MYQLLIVDDEPYSVMGIVGAIAWRDIGFLEPLTASDGERAVQLMEQRHVDIVLLDIEMPGMSGLALAKWMLEHHPTTVRLLLTCHAEFGYAQQAIELGVTEYLLKPVYPDVLRAALLRAAKRADELHTDEERLMLALERFWRELARGTTTLTPEALMRQYDIQLPDEKRTVVAIASIRDHADADVHSAELAVLARLNERLPESAFAFRWREGVLLCVAPRADGMLEDMREALRETAKQARAERGFLVQGYVGEAATLEGFAQCVARLAEADQNNVSCMELVYLVGEKQEEPQPVRPPKMDGWDALIRRGKPESLLAQINASVDALCWKRDANAVSFEYWLRDFMQVINVSISDMDLTASEVYGDLRLVPPRTASALKEYAGTLARRAVDAVEQARKEENIDIGIKRYIRENLTCQVTRESVAAHLYISPDHLTRIFRKQNGMAISEYIIQQKMLYAQNLLLDTNLQVTDVAHTLGYSSLSHFTKAFKKHLGRLPNECKRGYVAQEELPKNKP